MTEDEKKYIRSVSENGNHIGYAFYCPGCKYNHMVDERWKFDGNYERPTFTPSLITTTSIRCHLNITNGMINFHIDSEHDLAGKIVPMEEFE